MSQRTATITRAAVPRSRRRTTSRRRLIKLVICVALVALLVTIAIPLMRRAESEFGLPLAYSGVIRQQAAQKHLPPALIAAVIYAETKFDPRPSSAGAEGLMQILPQTALYLARRSGATTFRVSDLGTPAINIAYGSYYLRYLLDRYGDNKVLALAAYNGGETNVDRWLAIARDQGRTLTVQSIPFGETRAYVEKVLRAEQDYRSAYARQL